LFSIIDKKKTATKTRKFVVAVLKATAVANQINILITIYEINSSVRKSFSAF